ncbi:MAG: hypothetical protein Q4G03_06995 [Planctomycetia bacterium]|nr:hypothetical protein [Planctomycetia bacterium]
MSRPKPLDLNVVEHASQETTSKVIREIQQRSTLSGEGTPTLCFLGVSGDGAESLSTSTRTALEASSAFRLLDKSVVQAALKDSGVRANNVFIPAERKKLVDALGEPIDYLLAGYVESVSQDSDEDDEKSKGAANKLIYRLELVNIETNVKSEFTAEL